MNYYELSQICEINPPKRIELSAESEISFVPMENVSTTGCIDVSKTIAVSKVKNYSVFQNGDVLFAKITPCMENGKGAIAKDLKNGYGAGSTEFIVVRPDTSIVLAEWLFLYLSQKSFRMQCFHHMTGSAGQKRVPVKYLSSCRIPVPSLTEQTQILLRVNELLSQLDSGVETLKRTKAQLAVYRQAILKAAFEGRFTHEHLPISENLNWASTDEITLLPELPPEWQYIHLSELGDLGRGRSKHRPRNDPKLFEKGKYPFLQTGEVKSAGKYITSASKMYGEYGLSQSKLWPKGTLCITIAANIAETAFLGIDACFPDSVVGFTANDTILPEYVKYFIDSQKLRLWTFAPATAQKNINLDTLENLIVPYCSIKEQQMVVNEIENRLSVCDKIEDILILSLRQANSFRQSILKQFFEERL